MATIREAKANSLPYATLKQRTDNISRFVNYKNEKGKYKYLVKDRYAYGLVYRALMHDLIMHDLTLVYVYKGEHYSVHKKDVPGTKKTEVLHKMNLSMSEWDKMERFNVWVNTGMIYG